MCVQVSTLYQLPRRPRYLRNSNAAQYRGEKGLDFTRTVVAQVNTDAIAASNARTPSRFRRFSPLDHKPSMMGKTWHWKIYKREIQCEFVFQVSASTGRVRWACTFDRDRNLRRTHKSRSRRPRRNECRKDNPNRFDIHRCTCHHGKVDSCSKSPSSSHTLSSRSHPLEAPVARRIAGRCCYCSRR